MSTQFDQVFDGLSKNSLTLEDACRALHSELQASPQSMRVCCERIEIELSQGRISSDAAQLLLDALGEHSSEDEAPAAAAEIVPSADEVWVDVPLEPVVSQPLRSTLVGRANGTDTITELDLTVDDLLAALDRRGPVMSRSLLDVGDEQVASVEWVEFEPELSAPASEAFLQELPHSGTVIPASSPASAPVADDVAADVEVPPEPPVLNVVVATRVEPDEHTALTEAASHAKRVEVAESADQPESSEAPQLAAAKLFGAAFSGEDNPRPELPTQLAPVVAEVSADEAGAGPMNERASEDDSEPGSELVQPAEVGPAEVEFGAGSVAVWPATALGADPTQRIADASADASAAASETIFAPRFEHVLKESSPVQPGAVLKGRYRIVGVLHPGGFGSLLDAIDTQTQGEPRVTLKMIEVDWQEEPRAFDTLQAIVRHVRRLRHPNILSILDIERDDKHAIVVMEPLRGRWLSSLLRDVRDRGVGFAVAWNIISGIANGLAYAHQHGAVHAELNPHMIFLTEEGAVKIAGFGLAQAIPMSMEPLAGLEGLTLREYADAYSVTTWVHGSAPQGVDDLYPLGIIAYELLTGAHPFNRLSPIAAAARQCEPSPIPGLDRRIRRVIERCLSFDRQQRPVNGANFLARIEPSEQLLELVRERFKRPATDRPV